MRRRVRLVTGGTSNHLVLADVAASFGLTGRQAESALLEAGVVTNRNSIPRDANGAWYTSGIRMGTPALTTLGFEPDELDEIADIFATVLRRDRPRRGHVQGEVRPRRQGRRRQPGPLRRAARPPPALPRDRAVGRRSSRRASRRHARREKHLVVTGRCPVREIPSWHIVCGVVYGFQSMSRCSLPHDGV